MRPCYHLTTCTRQNRRVYRHIPSPHRSFWLVGEVVVDKYRLVLGEGLGKFSDLPQVFLFNGNDNGNDNDNDNASQGFTWTQP